MSNHDHRLLSGQSGLAHSPLPGAQCRIPLYVGVRGLSERERKRRKRRRKGQDRNVEPLVGEFPAGGKPK